MHKKTKGSTKVTLQGIDCYIPKRPALHSIQGYHLPKKKQKWYRTELPQFYARDIKIWSEEEYDADQLLDWEQVRREEHIKQTGCDPWNLDSKGKEKKVAGVDYDLAYVNPKLEAFRKQELGRIKNGHWFMNNGEPIYLPGIAYFFFNWWKIDIGYPDYRHYITEFSYAIESIRKDPTKLGIILASIRGIGKTYFSLAVAYCLTIQKKESLSGMQSKTDASAEGMWEKLTSCIMELPDFLVPIKKYKNVKTQNSMEFFPPYAAHPNPHYDRYLKKSALKSRMNYMSSSDGAYDSETLYCMLQDEIGKIEKPNSVRARFDISRNCVLRGAIKRGFILGFTTVGNMEKGPGTEFKTLYYDSDLLKAQEKAEREGKKFDGWTASGCVKYFINDLEATYFDEYGYSDREKAKEYHDSMRRKIHDEGERNGDLTSYIAYCQQNPRTESDAFMMMGKGCIFNASVLQNRQLVCSNPDYNGVVRGDLEWVEKWKKVQFVENKVNGLWTISWMPEDFLNKTEVRDEIGGGYSVTTKNNRYFGIGMDPTSHKKVQDQEKASKPSITVNAKFNVNWPDIHCDTPAANYVGRIEAIKEQAEDAIKASIFFGADILVEKNKSNVIQYIEEWGFGDILIMRPGARIGSGDYGVTSGPSVIESYTGMIKDHINPMAEGEMPNGMKLKHLAIVEDCLEFDPNNTTKYDSAVSYGYSLMASKMDNMAYEDESIEISDLFRTYAN